MSEAWFLVQCKPNAYKIAERNLKRQGLVTFLPLCETTRRQSTRFVTELRPLFSGYMFVRLDPATSTSLKIDSTYGVVRIVRFGQDPAPVPTGLVETLKARCDETGIILPNETLQVGERIAVVDGPFADFVGTIERIESQQRVWLLLEFMGKSKRINVGVNQVASRQ